MEQYLRASTAVPSLRYSSTGGSVLEIRTAQFLCLCLFLILVDGFCFISWKDLHLLYSHTVEVYVSLYSMLWVLTLSFRWDSKSPASLFGKNGCPSTGHSFFYVGNPV